jgi:hypothetical protein
MTTGKAPKRGPRGGSSGLAVLALIVAGMLLARYVEPHEHAGDAPERAAPPHAAAAGLLSGPPVRPLVASASEPLELPDLAAAPESPSSAPTEFECELVFELPLPADAAAGREASGSELRLLLQPVAPLPGFEGVRAYPVERVLPVMDLPQHDVRRAAERLTLPPWTFRLELRLDGRLVLERELRVEGDASEVFRVE